MGNNARYFVWANGLQNLGDQVVAAKTVLSALFQSAGVPNFFTGLLVPTASPVRCCRRQR